jgi:deoxyribonuclease V
MDGPEQIGRVLRTRDRTRPVYISIGHRVDLPSATELALACVTRYRIPEPTRHADIEVAKLKRRYEAQSP